MSVAILGFLSHLSIYLQQQKYLTTDEFGLFLLIHAAGSDHCFHTCRPFVLPHFSKQNKFQMRTMFATGETVGLAEWIIDDTCFVFFVPVEPFSEKFGTISAPGNSLFLMWRRLVSYQTWNSEVTLIRPLLKSFFGHQ